MFPFFFDPTMMLLIPALLLAMWAQMRVKSVLCGTAPSVPGGALRRLRLPGLFLTVSASSLFRCTVWAET